MAFREDCKCIEEQVRPFCLGAFGTWKLLCLECLFFMTGAFIRFVYAPEELVVCHYEDT